MALSCASNTSNSSTPDSINAIDQRHDINDTNVTPIPNGYAPPNDSVDTSKNMKDSIGSSKH